MFLPEEDDVLEMVMEPRVDTEFNGGFERIWSKASSTRTLIAIVIGVIVLTMAIERVMHADKHARCDWNTVAANARDVPLVMPFTPRPSYKASVRDAVDQNLELWRANAHNLDVSTALHLLHAYGKEFKVALNGRQSEQRMLDLLMDEESGRLVFGTAPIFRTDFGVRCRELSLRGGDGDLRRAGESHRDQFLAIMAELGIPLTQPIDVGRERLSLREMLSDSVSQFHLKQQELAWTAFAYALYLPPRHNWKNRFNEGYSFDGIVDELLSRSLATESCCGMHVVFALTAIIQSDSVYPILSPAARSRANDQRRQWITAIIAHQMSDGSWAADWWKSTTSSKENAPSQRNESVTLLATSHICEWMFMLPEDVLFPADTSERATRYLFNRLRVANEVDFRTEMCPYTHAYSILNRLADSQSGQRRSKSGNQQ